MVGANSEGAPGDAHAVRAAACDLALLHLVRQDSGRPAMSRAGRRVLAPGYSLSLTLGTARPESRWAHDRPPELHA